MSGSGGALNLTSLSGRFLTETLPWADLGVAYDTWGRPGQTRPIAVEPVLLLGNHSLSILLASLSGPRRVPTFARSPAPVGRMRVANQTSNCLVAD